MSVESPPLLRHDATTNDWVLFAPTRARRPHEVVARVPGADAAAPEACPFCPGNERLAADEVLRIDDGRGGWSVRVITNKFPALVPTATPAQRVLGPVFREMGGYGRHEVVVESPEHARPLSRQPVEQVERVLQAVHRRFVALMADDAVRAIVVFKNHGEKAGTSIVHPHWQMVAMPVVPHLLRAKHAISAEYFDRTSRCVYCVTRDDELASGARVLATNEGYAAILPWASHVPYQVRILPRAHQSSFALASPAQLRGLAEILRLALERIDRALGAPDFNLTLGTAPIGDEEKRYFLWHVDVLPRLGTFAGFELGSGMSINPVLPEDAAAVLRAAG